MEFFKKIWNKIKTPRGIWIALFYVLFVLVVAGTLTLVILQPQQTVGHYILYCVSAIMLTYFVYTIVYFAPRIRRNIIKTLKKYKYTRILLENHGLRALIFAIFGFILNVAYLTFMFVLAIMSRSAWYFSMTAYYLILSLMKGNIFYSKKRYNTERKQARAFRFCGIMFILLTIAYSGVIVLIYTSNMYFEYAGLMIYAAAAYTFYKLTMNIINAVKARKEDDLYLRSLRNINLVTALISIIVLQVAMFQAFSPENNTSIANGLTGGAVSLAIMALGIFMIVKANKILKQQEEKNEEQK